MKLLDMLAWLKANKDKRGVLTKLSEGLDVDRSTGEDLARGSCPLKLRQLNGWTSKPTYMIEDEEDQKMLSALLRLTSNRR